MATAKKKPLTELFSDQSLNADLPKRIGNEWDSLLFRLGLTGVDMDHINHDHRLLKDKIKDGLYTWTRRKKQTPVRKLAADFLEALRAVDMVPLSEDLEDEYDFDEDVERPPDVEEKPRDTSANISTRSTREESGDIIMDPDPPQHNRSDLTETGPDINGNFPLRDYQMEIAQDGLRGDNSIIWAGTGSGKTRVAVYIMKNHLDKSTGRIAFFNTTLTLLDQQYEVLCKFLPKYKHQILKLSGADRDSDTLLPDTQYFRVCVLTPMTLEKYLAQGTVSLDLFSMLVFDECHHTRKNEPYNQIMKYYRKLLRQDRAAKLPQILGLTASVGTERACNVGDAEKSILELMARMNVYKIATPSINRQEYIQYVPEPKKHSEVMKDRPTDPFSDIIEDAMYRLEEWLRTKLCGIDKDVHDLLGEIPDNTRMEQQYQSWLSRLLRAIPLSKELSPEIQHQAIVVAEHLTMYQTALRVNHTLSMKDVLEHLYLSSLKYKILRGISDSPGSDKGNTKCDNADVDRTENDNTDHRGRDNTAVDHTGCDNADVDRTENDNTDHSGRDNTAVDHTGCDNADVDRTENDNSDHTGRDNTAVDHTGCDNADVDRTENDNSDHTGRDNTAVDHTGCDNADVDHTGSDDADMGNTESDNADEYHAGRDNTDVDHTASDDAHMDHAGNDIADQTGNNADEHSARNDETESTVVGLYKDVTKKLELHSKNEQYENPNIVRLQEMVDNNFREKGNDSTFIVFVEQRESAIAVSKYLREKSSFAKCCYLISAQSTTEGDGKQSQAEHNRVVKKLRSKQINGLVATQVAEEGLDIPACNFVIRYNKSSNEISTIQAGGRSRSMHGTIIDFASHRKHRQEQENVMKVTLMTQALENVLRRPVDNIRQEVTERMVYFTEKEAEEERYKDAGKTNKTQGDFTLRCWRCQKVAVSSPDIRRFKDTNYIVVGSDFYRNAKRRLNKKVRRYENMATKYKVDCKNCGCEWGEGNCMENIFFAVLKIKQFIVKDNVTGKEYSRVAWSAIPYTVQTMTEDDFPSLSALEKLIDE